MVGPTPGTEAMRSSFSRQVGEPRTASSMSVSRLESSFCSAASRRAMLFCRRFSVRGLLPLALGDDHLDDLSASSDKIGQKPGLFGRASAWCPVWLQEMGGHHRVDRLGLGPFSEPLAKARTSCRIDHDDSRPAAERLAATTVS
jgi:hypothetical protein